MRKRKENDRKMRERKKGRQRKKKERKGRQLIFLKTMPCVIRFSHNITWVTVTAIRTTTYASCKGLMEVVVATINHVL
jgi:hypothetical protein